MQRKILIIISLISVVFVSCNRTFYPSDMYKVKDKALFAPTSELMEPAKPLLQPGDNLSISVFSNKGEKLLEPLSNALQQSNTMNSPLVFTIDSSGNVLLPIIGQMHVSGLTVEQAENKISDSYSNTVIDPYVQISVLNKRIFFIAGGVNQSAVSIPYLNENTTLIDVITTAGGIKEGKASAIRLIRNTVNGLKIYEVDLSDFSQAKFSFATVLPNDIVYVVPQYRQFRKFVENLAPYLTLISTGLIIYNITR